MIYKLLNMRASNTIFVEISKVCKSETEDTSSRNLSNNLSLNLQIDSIFISCALSSESGKYLCVRTSEETEIISAWLCIIGKQFV